VGSFCLVRLMKRFAETILRQGKHKVTDLSVEEIKEGAEDLPTQDE
jgi:hypothetical protein